MKLSVIIPVYNCETYLERCLDSVLRQRLDKGDELEVITVDDGSTDGCAAILDRYAAEHDNIQVLRQSNKGVSVARNNGLDLVHGDYIHFLDSDDFLLFDDSYHHLLNLIRQSDSIVDVLCFSMVRDDSSAGENQSDLYNFKEAGIRFHGTGRDACEKSIFDGFIGPVLFNAELIRNYQIRFDPDILWAEDVNFNLKVYAHAECVASTNANIYGYYCNPESVSLTTDKKCLMKVVENVIDSTPYFKQLLEAFNLPVFAQQRMAGRGHLVATRLLSCNPSLKVTQSFIRKGFELQLFPLVRQNRKDNSIIIIIDKMLDRLLRHPFAFWLMSFPYRYVFNMLLKPLLLRLQR